jgi:hypothetical protein
LDATLGWLGVLYAIVMMTAMIPLMMMMIVLHSVYRLYCVQLYTLMVLLLWHVLPSRDVCVDIQSLDVIKGRYWLRAILLDVLATKFAPLW